MTAGDWQDILIDAADAFLMRRPKHINISAAEVWMSAGALYTTHAGNAFAVAGCLFWLLIVRLARSWREVG